MHEPKISQEVKTVFLKLYLSTQLQLCRNLCTRLSVFKTKHLRSLRMVKRKGDFSGDVQKSPLQKSITRSEIQNVKSLFVAPAVGTSLSVS